MKKKIIIYTTIILLSFFLGFTSNLLFKENKNPQSSQLQETRESGYDLINPLLECEQINNIGDSELKTLKTKLEKVLANYPETEVGLYYRDLNNGPWIGINEDQTFSPQSLLKLPVALAYYKLAENSPQLLEKEIEYDTEIENINLEENLELKQSYPVDFLIQRMITKSDNVAFNLLTMELSDEYIKKVHQDLGIAYPNESTPNEFISVKEYSSIFRVLYNSSYLSRHYSEMILNYLASSEFSKGLKAGIKEDIVIAHKHGVLNNNNPNQSSQLHDCGIIYLPEKPYLLCVMSKGKNKQELYKVIQEISKTVFEEIGRN